MKKLLAFFIVFKVAEGFFFVDPAFQTMPPIFNNPFWKNFENSMKELEISLKNGQHGMISEDMDSEMNSSEVTELETSPQDPFGLFPGFFGMQAAKPWWLGTNVCVTKEETDLATKNETSSDTSFFNGMRTRSQACSGATGRYTCVVDETGGGKHTRITTQYECCHGYQLQGNKCNQVNLKNWTETANEAAPEFSRMLETAGVFEKLEKDNENFTLFVTGDQTLDDLRENFEEMNQLDLLVPPTRRRRDVSSEVEGSARQGRAEGDESSQLKKVLLNHAVKGVHRAADIDNNEVLETLSGNTLRMNVFSNPTGLILTANCKRVIKKDLMAEKGMVHVVDGVLKPVERTAAQIIKEDDRFSIFRSMLEQANLMDRIDTETVTVFAPTDEAFSTLGDRASCGDSVVKHHIAPYVLCLSGLSDSWSFDALSGENVRITRDAAGVIVDNHSHITLGDVMATNGVVHVLDQVLMPDAGRNLTEMLASRNLTTFQKLMNEAGIDSSDSNLTWFVPRDDVFTNEEAQTELERIRAGDPAKLRDLLLYHSTQPQIELSALSNEQVLETRAKTPLRFNFYSPGPSFTFSQPRATVNCARVRLTENRACGANIHEIDRLLIPPSGDVLAVINDKPEFSILNKVIQIAELTDDLRAAPLTLLAPTDDAFNDLPARVLNSLLADKDEARKVLLRHILPESVCCNGVSGQQWLFPHHVASKDGSRLQTRRDSLGHVHFGRTRVSNCDAIATNGIVHTVTRVLAPRENHHNPFSSFGLDGAMGGWRQKSDKNPNVDILLFGL